MKQAPLNVFLPAGLEWPIRQLVESNGTWFTCVSRPSDADAIIFDHDSVEKIRSATEFQEYPTKCFTVSEADDPTYFLPGCYASHTSGFQTRGRCITIPYLLTQRKHPN